MTRTALLLGRLDAQRFRRAVRAVPRPPRRRPPSATSTAGGAQPTAETVSPSDVGSIAAQNGVSPSLAEAIADQESGFNNNEVSSTGATGVMQIEPGTWSTSASSAARRSRRPRPRDNVRGGVELLHSLLDQTGGDPALAAAAYYQGLASVRQHGLYSDTQQYVNNVLALTASLRRLSAGAADPPGRRRGR